MASSTASEPNPILQIEARLTPQCSILYDTMKRSIHRYLIMTQETLMCGQEFVRITDSDDELVRTHVEWIKVMEASGVRLYHDIQDRKQDLKDEGLSEPYDIEDVELSIHVYQVHDQGPEEEYGDTGMGEDEAVMMAHHWTLPSKELEGVWDNLVFDNQLQLKLLEYVRTTMLFSDKRVNQDLISWNRVVLLHGPPGTGKTSLCRGLAQKLSIRLSDRFRYGKLIEINSHSLFSKWFSESGKMVQRMFDQIWGVVNDENAFVCVLIDEVESLATARKGAMSAGEPSDSIRVVNALLTQLDRLKKRNNVLILTTSNTTEAIDLAFIDRADIKMHIGLPSQSAIYIILRSTVLELMEREIIFPHVVLLKWADYETLVSRRSVVWEEIWAAPRLHEIAGLAQGMSGRAIRKLPFLAHAGYIQSPTTTMEVFLTALERTVQDERLSRSLMDTFESVHGNKR